MRILQMLFAALSLSACASVDSSDVVRATMPLKILRDEGQPPRLGEVRVEVGGTSDGDRFNLSIYFDSDGNTLGTPRSVGWQMKFTGYCRDTAGWLQSVLIGPSGQKWSVRRVFVPAGPDRQQDWSSGGFQAGGGPEAQALLDAAAAGGRFTLALQDDEGRLWNETVIDTLSPRQRQRLFAANRAAVAAADPVTTPVAGETMLLVVRREQVNLPWPPRTCPTPPTATGGAGSTGTGATTP